MPRVVRRNASLLLASTLLSSLPAMAQKDNTWSSGAPMPVATEGAATAVLNGIFYVVGGYNSSGYLADTQIYNVGTNTWTTGAALPTATRGGVLAAIGSKLYFIGGYTSSGSSTDEVYIYTPRTNKWVAGTNPMPTARGDATAAVVNGVIYVIGGSSSFQGERLTTVESYNPTTDVWTEEAPMLLGKSEPSAGVFESKTGGFTIAVADGYNPTVGDTGDNESYSVSDNSWSALKDDPQPRDEACSAAIGGELFVAGGVDDGSSPLSLTEAYNVTTNVWESKASIPRPVTYAAGGAYKNLMYCFGGGSSNVFTGTYYNNVQIFKP
jgi:large repetitive protein